MLTCGGFDVLSAHVSIPGRGPAVVRVSLDTPNTAPPTSLRLSEPGGISLACTVVGGGVDTATLRWDGILVGGAGGLSRPVIGAFEQPQVRDLLGSITDQAGEQLATTIDPAVLSLEIPAWTIRRASATAALDQLAAAVALALALPVTWRVLGDGKIWMGPETWPAAKLPAGDEVLDSIASENRTIIGARVPWLIPGVDLAGVGRVVSVTHWIEPDSVRTWAWT